MSDESAIDRVTAAEVMQGNVTTIPATMRLDEVERVLSENGISGAPVVDHAGRIQGVISQSDLVEHRAGEPSADSAAERWAAAMEPGDVATEAASTIVPPDADLPAGAVPEEEAREQRELQRMARGEGLPLDDPWTAGAVMTAEVHEVESDATLAEVAAAMVDHGVHRVLVRERGELAGLVSSMDVLRAVARHGRRRA